jgi:HEAT repeat protein
MDSGIIIKNLIRALSSSNDLNRVKSRKELVAIGKPAVSFLIDALKNSNHLVRWEAAKALGEIGDPEAAPSLVEALEDEEFEVRWRAAEALIRMKTKGLEPLLHALIHRADSAFLREGAHHVLHELARGELRACLAPVLIALGSFEPAVEVPAAALRAMETMEAPPNKVNNSDVASLRRLAVAIPSQIAADAHKRARRYTRSLH